jgi:hypothetical protein
VCVADGATTPGLLEGLGVVVGATADHDGFLTAVDVPRETTT